jgi:hypothetical protein
MLTTGTRQMAFVKGRDPSTAPAFAIANAGFAQDDYLKKVTERQLQFSEGFYVF